MLRASHYRDPGTVQHVPTRSPMNCDSITFQINSSAISGASTFPVCKHTSGSDLTTVQMPSRPARTPGRVSASATEAVRVQQWPARVPHWCRPSTLNEEIPQGTDRRGGTSSASAAASAAGCNANTIHTLAESPREPLAASPIISSTEELPDIWRARRSLAKECNCSFGSQCPGLFTICHSDHDVSSFFVLWHVIKWSR